MSDPRPPRRFGGEIERQFLDSRVNALISVNLNTFWSIAIILLLFGLWDLFVDASRWRSTFLIRVVGAAIVVVTGLFQTLPGNAHWLPRLSKVRLVIAVVTSAAVAATLGDGYGFGVAGLVVIILTGPYIAIDGRDLLIANLSILASLAPVMFAVSLSRFDMIGTVVFVLLAVAVSTLLGRVVEASHRRAFAFELALHHDARTDSLTSLNNRRAMQERGRVELKRATRTKTPVSVILCDLDHFKNINDRYGHEAGDSALCHVAAVLRDALRETDALGRWGGEEFIVLLPATAAPGAFEVAERMRIAIETTNFAGVDGGTTISLGVATSQSLEDPGMEWDLLMKEADQRLYRAKHEGRNRTVSSGS